MIRGNTVRRPWSGRLAVLIGLAGLGLLFSASEATAGCMVPGTPKSGSTAFTSAHASLPPIQQASDGGGQAATIVGMWHVVYTATYSTSGPIPVPVVPPGSFEFLQSMKTWHADGTEWEEKIQPAPTGYCFGVWTHAAGDTVKLHHFGTITGPDGGTVAIFWQDEINRVAPDGTTYSGTWEFKLYGPTDIYGTGPVLQEIRGVAAARRITVQ